MLCGERSRRFVADRQTEDTPKHRFSDRQATRSALRPFGPFRDGGRTEFLAFCRYLRSLHPHHLRIAIVLDNFSPHTSTAHDDRVEAWARANNVELAYTPHYASWLNRIEAQFTALRYFCLDGTDHASHWEQARTIRRYIAWRNHHVHDHELQQIVKRANVA